MRTPRRIGPLALLALGLGLATAAPAQEAPSEEQLLQQIEGMRRAFESEPRAAGDRPQAQPELDQAEIARLEQQLSEQLGVEVLDVRALEADGREAYAVKVMNPGGNSNAAFLVTTLLVDKESGEVLGQIPQSIGTAAEFSKSGAEFQPNEGGSGLTIRRRTFR